MPDYSDQFEKDGFCIIRGGIDLKIVDNVNFVIDKFLAQHKSMLEKEDLLAQGYKSPSLGNTLERCFYRSNRELKICYG